MGTGIVPDDAVDSDTMIEELEGYMAYYETVVDMLQQRLETLGESTCICGECINDYHTECGILKQ